MKNLRPNKIDVTVLICLSVIGLCLGAAGNSLQWYSFITIPASTAAGWVLGVVLRDRK